MRARKAVRRVGVCGGLVLAAFAFVSCGTGRAGADGAARPVTHTVVMDGTAFAPADLTVKAGDIVVWTNKDPFPHTATSKSAPFDSGELDEGASWRYTAFKKGTFDYICTLHPTMKATLRVE